MSASSSDRVLKCWALSFTSSMLECKHFTVYQLSKAPGGVFKTVINKPVVVCCWLPVNIFMVSNFANKTIIDSCHLVSQRTRCTPIQFYGRIAINKAPLRTWAECTIIYIIKQSWHLWFLLWLAFWGNPVLGNLFSINRLPLVPCKRYSNLTFVI